MILKALYDYYQRSTDLLPAFGRELKEIGFLLVIDKEGHFLRFEDRRFDKKSAQKFLVKKHVGRTSAIVPNLLYDNSSYVFGYSEKGDTTAQFEAFKAKVLTLYRVAPQNADLIALCKFYEQGHNAILTQLSQDPLWDEVVKNLNKKYSTFSFLLDGDTQIMAQKTNLIDLDEEEQKDELSVCLISGERGICVDTTTATMIPGSQATAKLVAFQVNSGYDS